MVRVILSLLYTALLLGANAAVADVPQAQALQAGDMRKLVFHASPKPMTNSPLVDLMDATQYLSRDQGRWVLLNFWATWCAPCRKEMPSLDRLADTLAGPDFAVVTIATGPNPLPAISALISDAGLKNLTFLRDPNSQMARDSGVLALPVSLVLNPEGQEVGRFIGDADWSSPNAIALFSALIQ
ncbi:MAG: thiol-disulfide isomerase/thioredoxin [Paracoccaceae bacterium]|jgi:thiol-disulfide isomerase/thioredoxin